VTEVAREVRLDFARRPRIGLDEAVLCEHKSLEQILHIIEEARIRGRSLLLTRLDGAAHARLPAEVAGALDYCPASRTAFFGAVPAARGPARIAVVAGGSSDAPVAREAARTLAFSGEASELIVDVGVAGLWRLLGEVGRLERMAAVIVVAGMEAALVSVVAGLVPGVVVAVPTSTGYGVAAGGETALRAALTSCAPGVVAVNIDNGYGAACAALRILNAARAPSDERGDAG
jgi:NCAIR mutase (PurE)-related protein